VTTWGIFSDEGMTDGPYYYEANAIHDLADYVREDADNAEYLKIEVLCEDHPENAANGCEECWAEEYEEEED
jgi:hypothetical protein